MLLSQINNREENIVSQQSLFESTYDSKKNLLPFDGEVYYLGKIFTEKQAEDYFLSLSESVPWKADEVEIWGKHIVTRRKVAWFSDLGIEYSYSRTTKKSEIWNAELLAIKRIVEELSGRTFNSCLLNYYHDGEDGVSWHSDSESLFHKQSSIASVSFGAERVFQFKHKRESAKTSLSLENGSLLLMQGETQTHWKHALPKSKKVKTPRINLTFRLVKMDPP